MVTFQGWHLWCTQGLFDKQKATFEQINNNCFVDGELVNDKLNPILYIRRYPIRIHKRYTDGLEAVIKGHKLYNNKNAQYFIGHITDVFDEYEKEAVSGALKTKIVVVEWGYYSMKKFMSEKYGILKEITPNQD